MCKKASFLRIGKQQDDKDLSRLLLLTYSCPLCTLLK